MCVCDIFIHSSVDGHFGCFCILTVINIMLLWALGSCISLTWCYCSFWICIPRSGCAGSYGNSVVSFFEKPPYCFPQWLHRFIFPPTVSEGFLFSTSSPVFVIHVLFDDGHSDKFEAITSLCFWLTFPWWLAMLSIFSCACQPSAWVRRFLSQQWNDASLSPGFLSLAHS